MRKKTRKNIHFNINQRSFHFNDYIETNQKLKNKNHKLISDDRIYILFFSFVSLILVFSLKITLVSIQKTDFSKTKNSSTHFVSARRDIVDRNGELLARNIQTYHAGIRSNLVKDKKKFLVNVKLLFPELNKENIKNKLSKTKYFYLKRRLTSDEKHKLRTLGEKSVEFDPYQSRIYPQAKLFSHILGQIDNDNYGISGVERFFDKELRSEVNHKPIMLSLDSNLQYLIKSELSKSLDIFKAKGAAGLLMNAQNGEVLSLVSLPDYNINVRNKITHKKFNNKITNGIFELGSIFKTFTIALALEEKIVEPETLIKNIPNKVKCSSIHDISDMKKFPSTLSVEDILIRSSNVGTLFIARKIGEKSYKNFLKKMNLTNRINFELDEVARPLKFKWEKCKLETVSFGRGITTTPLQAAAGYASLINGGNLIHPTILKKNSKEKTQRIVSEETSKKIQKILRKVVTDKEGTASLADVFGYNVSGKTGTSQYYEDKDKSMNTFISFFTSNKKKYVLLVMLDDPQIAYDLVYDYRGLKIKGFRNEAGWNVVYSAGKIIEKIGPILAINNNQFDSNYVVKKTN